MQTSCLTVYLFLQLLDYTLYVTTSRIESDYNTPLGIIALDLIWTDFKRDVGKLCYGNLLACRSSDVKTSDVFD